MPNLEITDLKAMRTFVRASGIGLLPSQERSAAVLDVIEAHGNSPVLDRVREIATSVRGGMLPTQDICLQASREIERMIAGADARHDMERPGLRNG